MILAVALFGTHGINPRSVIAFLGTYGAVLVTSLVAYPSVHIMRLTGFGNDASVYLNFATNGQLDLVGSDFAERLADCLSGIEEPFHRAKRAARDCPIL